MSVTTTADELRDELTQDLNKAIEKISKIVIDRVWGYEDYTDSFQGFLRETLFDLMSIRDRIER